MKAGKPWSPWELTTLTKLYPDQTAKEISLAIDRSVSSIYRQARILGLSKSAEFYANPKSGRTDGTIGESGRFRNGQEPHNKGIKGWDAGGRSRKTRFKPGQDPYNKQPIGAYRIDAQGLLQRKISNSPGSNSMRWRGVHELVWVETNGSVPAGHFVVFRPGMRTNILDEITIDRVELVSRVQHMRRHTLHNYPKEIAHAIQLRGALNRRINNVEKQNNR